jgi:hypothetical protein
MTRETAKKRVKANKNKITEIYQKACGIINDRVNG